MNSVQIRSFIWSVFSCIRTEYGDLRCKSVRIQENTDQKKLRIWTLFTQCQYVRSAYKNNFNTGKDRCGVAQHFLIRFIDIVILEKIENYLID